MKKLSWIAVLIAEHALRIGTVYILLVVLNDDSFTLYDQLSVTAMVLLMYGALAPFAIDVHELVIKKKHDSFADYFMHRGVRVTKIFMLSFFPVALVGGIIDAVALESGVAYFTDEILAPIFVSTMGAVVSMAFVLIPVMIAKTPPPQKKG